MFMIVVGCIDQGFERFETRAAAQECLDTWRFDCLDIGEPWRDLYDIIEI